MCLYFVFCWVFLRGFLLGFSPLVGVGQHLPKSCHSMCPSSVLCVLCFVLAVIMTFSSGVHRVSYLILADVCVQHISCV